MSATSRHQNIPSSSKVARPDLGPIIEDTAMAQFQKNEESVDGCVCDIELNQSEALSDAELPPTSGGVQAAVENRDNEDSFDGCGLAFNADILTTDRELPAAAGGVQKAGSIGRD